MYANQILKLVVRSGKQTTTRLLTQKIPLQDKLLVTNSWKTNSGQVSAYPVRTNSREQLIQLEKVLLRWYKFDGYQYVGSSKTRRAIQV